MNALLDELHSRGSCAVDSRPLEVYLSARVCHLSAEGKGVDRGDLTVDRVVADVAQLVALRERARYRTENELRLVHSGVIGRDVAVRLVERAVHDADFGVLNRSTEARLSQSRGGGEDQLSAVLDRQLNDLERVVFHCVVVGSGDDLILKDALDVLSALLMVVYPARALGSAVVNEGDAEHGGSGRGGDHL